MVNRSKKTANSAPKSAKNAPNRVLAGSMIALFVVFSTSGPVLADKPAHLVPEKLQGMALSGRVLDLVADRIDPELPLGTCADEPLPHEVRVTVSEVKNSDGNIRLSLYSGIKKEWMAKGMKLLRFDVPAQEGETIICMPLPNGVGDYGLALYHDENADGDYGFSSEGYGFSNNAKAGWVSPAPFKKAVFTASDPRTEMNIRVRY